DGGRVTNTTDVSIGRDNGSTGNVTVSGAGSTWESPSGFGFRIGDGGTGTLNINDGGVVRSGQGLIGVSSGSDGHVTVSGPGSAWVPVDNIYVGFEGTGNLEVLNGAAVSTEQNGGGAATIYVGL